MRLAAILLSTVLVTSTIGRQQSQTAPARQPPRYEDTLSKTVVRITSTAEGVSADLNATGFLVGIPDARLPQQPITFYYLVTNRHVAEAILPDANERPVKHRILTMTATVNLKQSVNGSRIHPISLPSAGTKWVFPDDNAIDLAVIPIPLNSETYDVMILSPESFLTPDRWEKFRIGPGDKVITCGYFLHYAGSHQFQPIVREGSLAMVPDDEMPVPIGGSAKVYLADIHIIPGNSGSPLFLTPAFTLGGYVASEVGEVPYGVLGVVSAYIWEDNELTLHAATDYEGTIHANSGIAMIVPVSQLKDLLYGSELQKQRDALFAAKPKP